MSSGVDRSCSVDLDGLHHLPQYLHFFTSKSSLILLHSSSCACLRRNDHGGHCVRRRCAVHISAAMLPRSPVRSIREPVTHSSAVGESQKGPQARPERHPADRDKCIMAPTHPMVSPEAVSYLREHSDHEGDLQPTLTPANTATSFRPFDTDSGSEYSERDTACEDQDLSLPTRQARSSSTPASGPRKGILQSPRPRSPSAGDVKTDKQKRAHFDEHLLELDAAIRRVATDPSHLHSTTPSGLHSQGAAAEVLPRA